jgi:hypothetical protein
MPLQEAASVDLPESERLDLERRRLECEKLRVEIAQAAAPWWTRAGYIGSLVPIVITLVGFFSALAAGFFDTERQRLNTEIDGLALRRDQLLASNQEIQGRIEGIQSRIDKAYITLRVASSDVEYAIGLVEEIGADPSREELAPKVTSILRRLPADEADVLGEVLISYDFSMEMVEVARDGLKNLSESLQAIPASKWATELEPTLTGYYISGRAVLLAPDGTLYDLESARYYQEGPPGTFRDLESGKSYSREELEKLLRSPAASVVSAPD